MRSILWSSEANWAWSESRPNNEHGSLNSRRDSNNEEDDDDEEEEEEA